jgi:hypothetical protein
MLLGATFLIEYVGIWTLYAAIVPEDGLYFQLRHTNQPSEVHVPGGGFCQSLAFTTPVSQVSEVEDARMRVRRLAM